MILHELLTGSPMFAAESPTAVLIMISTAPTTPLRTLRADAPPELERVLLRCLEKDRTRRYVDVAAFARAIGPFASDVGRASVERVAKILRVDDVDDNPWPQSSGDMARPVVPGATPPGPRNENVSASSRRRRARSSRWSLFWRPARRTPRRNREPHRRRSRPCLRRPSNHPPCPRPRAHAGRHPAAAGPVGRTSRGQVEVDRCTGVRATRRHRPSLSRPHPETQAENARSAASTTESARQGSLRRSQMISCTRSK